MNRTHSLTVTTALVLGLAIAGCSTQPKTPAEALAGSQNHCHFSGTDQEAPAWVCTGFVAEDLVTGMGAFPPSRASHSLRFQTAAQRARVDLAKKLETRLTSSLKDYEEQTGAGMSETVDRVVQQASQSRQDVTLVGSRVYRSVEGPDGTLYVLVGIDRKLAGENLQRLVRSSYRNPEAAHQRGLAREALEALEQVATQAMED